MFAGSGTFPDLLTRTRQGGRRIGVVSVGKLEWRLWQRRAAVTRCRHAMIAIINWFEVTHIVQHNGLAAMAGQCSNNTMQLRYRYNHPIHNHKHTRGHHRAPPPAPPAAAPAPPAALPRLVAAAARLAAAAAAAAAPLLAAAAQPPPVPPAAAGVSAR